MSVVTKAIDVDVPTRVAYNQWTQFEEFPRFMEGVESIEQIDDVRLRWHVSVGGADRTFEAVIEEQEPDMVIAWRAVEGEVHAGRVSFEPLEDDRTRVEVEMAYEPERWTEKVADAFSIIERRVQGDLERFKEFIEGTGGETGAWRGEIDDAQVTDEDPGGRGSATGVAQPGVSTHEPGDRAAVSFGNELSGARPMGDTPRH